ncbi:MAG: hypothetical protein R2751_08810 [Bacteroidales bacterium]
MNKNIHPPSDNQGAKLGSFLLSQLKPRGAIFTPFNLLSIPVMTLGIFLIVLRFVKGIGAVAT